MSEGFLVALWRASNSWNLLIGTPYVQAFIFKLQCSAVPKVSKWGFQSYNCNLTYVVVFVSDFVVRRRKRRRRREVNDTCDYDRYFVAIFELLVSNGG